jgi:hypothetical protein
MMVISQRPARVDKNVLSQCGTQIIMKVTNPNDLKAISKGLEGVSSYVEDELMRLPPGVAMLVSNDIERPILVDIRIRKSKHGGESVNVLKAAKAKGPAPAPEVATKVPVVKARETHVPTAHVPTTPVTAKPPVQVEAPPVQEQEQPISPPPKRQPSRPPRNEGGKLFTRIFGSGK